MESGQVFNIQRYSIHDGDGIRTTVFLSGCPLHCLWCHNPECHDKYAGKLMSAQEVFEQIEKDRIFYSSSGGGVTLSGGEPFLQPEFTADILRCCNESGIHTALETSGFALWTQIQKSLPYTDLFLYDLKDMNAQRHKQHTGQDNTLILENVKRIFEAGKRIVIRMPLIPNYNAFDDHLRSASKFIVENLSSKIQINLLPYHKMGTLGNINAEPPTDGEMEDYKSLMASYGLSVKIGG